jgi:hypothetical protein
VAARELVVAAEVPRPVLAPSEHERPVEVDGLPAERAAGDAQSFSGHARL